MVKPYICTPNTVHLQVQNKSSKLDFQSMIKSLFCLAILLSCVTFTYTVTQPRTKFLAKVESKASKTHKTNDLYYYHKFEKRHGWVPNTHIPLQQHYNNEKHLRQKLYKVEDDINHLKRQTGFGERKLKREVLKNKNALHTLKSVDHASDRLHGQRGMSIKEQINHYEKFREKYHKRLMKNRLKAQKALPDQRGEYDTLVKFDEARSKYFLGAANKEQEKLDKTRKENGEFKMKTRNNEAEAEARIARLEGKLKSTKENYKFKLQELEAEEAQLQEMVHAEEALDLKRRNNEVLENELS